MTIIYIMENNSIKHKNPEGGVPMGVTETKEYTEMRVRKYVEDVRANQNLSMGMAAGAVAAVVGAVIWGVITYVTQFQIGWMAVGVGILVGYAVRRFGQGVDLFFGISGAALALAGCIMGNLFASCIFISQQAQVGLMEVVARLDFVIAAQIMAETFNPIDLLFYGIAVYEGYRFSFKQISEEELASNIK
jgi:hypothetical protein